MKISIRRATRMFVVLAGVALFAVPATATAAPAAVDLTVEAGGQALAPISSRFLTDTTTFTTDKREPACGGTGQTKAIAGPTALGVLFDATATVPALGPVGVSDKFSFGQFVCGIGSFTGSDSAFWLYKVNHVSPEVGADQYPVKNGDKVLWYFQDTAAGRNGGDELAIEGLPARITAGSPFPVSVVTYSFNGVRSPAPDATIYVTGQDPTVTGPNGLATITLTHAGLAAFRAGRGTDIPSPVTKVCAAENVNDCPPIPGKRIRGSNGADTITGTGGPDAVVAAAGNDSIDVRGGFRDRVDCGPGSDTARISTGDRAARNCERVIKPKAKKHKHKKRKHKK